MCWIYISWNDMLSTMQRRKARTAPAPSREDYRTLATFRARLREFLAFSDQASASVGLTQQQYQALLALHSHPGPEPLTISGLAALLLIKHHSAVGMVDRLERQGIVRREASARDRRAVAIRLTASGARAMAKLAAVHRAELRRVAPEFRRIFAFLGKPDPE
jgi:DNA-binding MarR family transcriptional regulator